MGVAHALPSTDVPAQTGRLPVADAFDLGRGALGRMALAAAGIAVIGYAGDSQRPVPLGAMLLGISVAASVASAGDAVSPTRRTFATAAGCGASSVAAVAGVPSFGLALLPAALAWAAGLAIVEHPDDALQVGTAGMTIGVALGTIALLVATSV